MKTLPSILVPIDFSDLSREAFFVACDVARKFGATLMVMHVTDFISPSLYFAEGMLRLESDSELIDLRIATEKEIEKLMADERARSLRIHPILAMGVPSREIAEKAKHHKVDLIVMSTHGRTGISHFLLGSVAEDVIRKAPCPVLTLNPNVLSAIKNGELSISEVVGKGITHEHKL